MTDEGTVYQINSFANFMRATAETIQKIDRVIDATINGLIKVNDFSEWYSNFIKSFAEPEVNEPAWLVYPFGMTTRTNGRFTYDYRPLAITIGSRPGRILQDFLQAKDHYLENSQIKKEMHALTSIKSHSDLIYELKKMLRKDGLKAEISNVYGCGYTLENILEI